MSDPIIGVWRNPSTRTYHAVVLSGTGVRLACRPNTPTKIRREDVLDYRTSGAPKCWNEACWRHFMNPEAPDA